MDLLPARTGRAPGGLTRRLYQAAEGRKDGVAGMRSAQNKDQCGVDLRP